VRDRGTSGSGPLSRAELERLAGGVVVLRFAGTTAPDYVLRALRRRRVAGVILFRDNVVSRQQLGAMTRAFHRAAPGGRALVMIDQEGGEIRNVPWAPPRTAPPSIRTAADATATARATAAGLKAAGITVNLAPVADVASVPGSVMRTRAFPGDARSVARLVDAGVRGYEGTGVLPTVKHFPGLGRSQTNTDFGLATVPGAGELAPFAAAIRAGVPIVMTSHGLYPELDRTRIASQSRRVVTGLLRERLGFRGVIVTDSLEAKAVVGRTSTPVAAARALAAGHDLLLTTGRGSYLDVLREVARRSGRDPAFRARAEESAARVDALRRRLR
jgi:beta-N-acetylhexosaminidase